MDAAAGLTRRALAAYYQRANGTETPADTRVVEHEARLYVVLSNVTGTLAVYRVRGSGALRRMRRWPAEVAPRA